MDIAHSMIIFDPCGIFHAMITHTLVAVGVVIHGVCLSMYLQTSTGRVDYARYRLVHSHIRSNAWYLFMES